MERASEHGLVLVIGGTGKTGRHVVTELRRLGADVRVAARSTPARFDWFDESTWEAAVSGARRAYLVDAQNEHAAERMRAFAPFAVERGVERLVLLSARGWASSGDPELLATENALKDSGGAWTILRPTWFMQGFTEDDTLRAPVRSGELRLPSGDGLEPFIDAEDIAAVAAAVLTREGHEGSVYELSGPRALSMGEAVDTIAEATGRAIRYVPVSEEEYVAGLTADGVPPGQARFIAELFGWIRDGEDAHLSDGVQRILGRAPRDFAEFAKRAAAAGAWDD
ncbi:NAD(P)H-binding protein [Streptomyces sp. AK02-01A]|uniref:NmrA family NAD(P)-binding protein n=1 Tax=Streptomyces sp. AK02-01A TaxID=3028648 RepID=UPI0029B7EAF0|nr:NAD(P)H-binding protein [Streptomyces sp. AK02-01A]MDX3853681.1 NAD(P)H-binding protein [Streptomyces sp. AK02-01A]